ncbi:hypothetical protein MNEG_6345 [Monoraphidium neglectum]|uniref:Uncharacterized protein n=1 Tax=Monoraphidium neglectum TaxID=145388 RepID=A0A0D2JRE2_9CHLO|nr:hypothetical protein MNEG_6345 [Monoraphidium neglectum]KIZ01618.1 hypothetical protein MNEG_6345 [Monoraphidium neglectum]|eukprot:XP_013900637.1 hypothetical protein MNEG_6345 [Monoraphidium neglectum]
MVGFEVSTQDYKKLKKLPAAQRRAKIAKWAIGGAAGVAVVAGVTLALTFGSLASSVANTPVGDAMTSVGGADMDSMMQLFNNGGGDCCGGDCPAECHGCAVC